MREFAKRLRILRFEKKLSKLELSKKIQVGVASISHWENNESDIRMKHLILVAKFFDVSTDYLLGLTD